MTTNPQLTELAKTQGSHEDGAQDNFRCASTTWLWAGSAGPVPPATAMLGAGAGAGAEALDAAENGTKFDPEMGWFLVLRPPRMALFDPAGRHVGVLTEPLSALFTRLSPASAGKYGHALRRLLDAAHATADQLAPLFAGRAAARRAVARLLAAAGCQLRHHQLPAGGVRVTPPAPLVSCVDLALATLGHVYDWLDDHDRLGFANPLCSDAAPEAVPLQPGHHPITRHFVLTNRRASLPRRDDPHCIARILDAARAWPPGIALATRLCAAEGPRIHEVFCLDCRDWAATGFGDTLTCPNKGSRGARTKTLYLTPDLAQALAGYVDGPRRALTGIGLADLRRLAHADPDHPALAAPLLLNDHGRRISYSLYNDYYFRPTISPILPGVTPHWMRHERTFEGLRAIGELAVDTIEKAQLVETFAAMKGWRSGPEMAHYYAPQIRDLEQRRLAALIAARQQAPASPPPPAVAAPPILAAILAAGGA